MSWWWWFWYLMKHPFPPHLISLVPQLTEARVTIYNLHPQGGICKTPSEYLMKAVWLVRLVATFRISVWKFDFYQKCKLYIKLYLSTYPSGDPLSMFCFLHILLHLNSSIWNTDTGSHPRLQNSLSFHHRPKSKFINKTSYLVILINIFWLKLFEYICIKKQFKDIFG